jgi:hypothetical protein
VEGVKAILLSFALMLSVTALQAQEKKPWEVDRLCGKLEHVQKIPNRKDANTFSDKRKSLRDVPLALYNRRENEPCCGGLAAVEMVHTDRGGRFEFKNEKPGIIG